jgi:oxygen-independent coproporphyrinogen-3 oxidase
MCNFAIDLTALNTRPYADVLVPIHAAILRDFAGHVVQDGNMLRITAEGRPLTRIIAQRYDGFSDITAQYSQAS